MNLPDIFEYKQPEVTLADIEHENWLNAPHTQYMFSLLQKQREQFLEKACSVRHDKEQSFYYLTLADAMSKAQTILIKKTL